MNSSTQSSKLVILTNQLYTFPPLDCHVATLLAMTWHFLRLHYKIAVIAGVNEGGNILG